MKKSCLVCQSHDWLPLPDPVPSRSVTTSGIIVPQPLGKSACLRCGLVQRVRAEFLGLGSYYEEDYASYYERPGTEVYHRKRYQQLIDWMLNHLPAEANFSTVLDVGCGQGWAMDAMASHFPNIDICGIEPSEFNATIARNKGHHVFQGKIETLNIKKKFDLIYSNNVFQHVNDPVSFLTSIRELANPDAVIVITCPDGSKPNIELLFSDHNYSFLPGNLLKIGKDMAFDTVYWDASRENPSLPPAQLILLTDNRVYAKEKIKKPGFLNPALDDIASQKMNYLNTLKTLNQHLMSLLQSSCSVYNFGASFWTSVLAAYCPDYWNHVKACVVDKKDKVDEFMGKKIMALKEIPDHKNTYIVLGTNPATHEALSRKMKGQDIIRWDSFFKY